jgi:hypothetical protein
VYYQGFLKRRRERNRSHAPQLCAQFYSCKWWSTCKTDCLLVRVPTARAALQGRIIQNPGGPHRQQPPVETHTSAILTQVCRKANQNSGVGCPTPTACYGGFLGLIVIVVVPDLETTTLTLNFSEFGITICTTRFFTFHLLNARCCVTNSERFLFLEQ